MNANLSPGVREQPGCEAVAFLNERVRELERAMGWDVRELDLADLDFNFAQPIPTAPQIAKVHGLLKSRDN
jgi:hypothetical protein